MPQRTHTIMTVSAGGRLGIKPDGSDVVHAYHKEAVAHDQPSCGPLKVGDRLESDPDGLVTFVRIGDFKPQDKRRAPTVRLARPE